MPSIEQSLLGKFLVQKNKYIFSPLYVAQDET